MSRRLSFTTVAVLRAVAAGCRFGLAVMRETGLPSGTVYPILARAEDAGYVRGAWEHDSGPSTEHDSSPSTVGRPRRRYYELTSAGAHALEHALAEMAELAAHRVPAPNE